MASRDEDTVALIALGAGVVMATAQFAGHVATGASALSASATQAIVGASSAALMLFGSRRAAADRLRERGFWSFVAPILPLSIGAGTTIFEGTERLRSVRQLEQPAIAYAALGIAALFAALAIWSIASAFNARALTMRRLTDVRAADEPVLFALLLLGLGALASIGVTVLGVFAADRIGVRDADGLATIAAGLIMAAVAALFAIETKSLLMRRDERPATRAPAQPAAGTGDDEKLDAALVGAVVTGHDDQAAVHTSANRKSRKKSRRSGR